MSTRCFYVIFIHAKIRRGARHDRFMLRNVEGFGSWVIINTAAWMHIGWWFFNASDAKGFAVFGGGQVAAKDRKSTRLNSSHVSISYAVFCLKKKNKTSYRS